MTLVKWRNRMPVNNMFNDMDRLFNNLFIPIKSTSENWMPDFNIKESDKTFTLFADLPGLTKKDIVINISHDILNITGERKSNFTDQSDIWLTVEQQFGTFSRTFNLPENVNESKISAKFKNGVLTLEIPKIKAVQPVVNRIAIS